jgi:hypothetical protein
VARKMLVAKSQGKIPFEMWMWLEEDIKMFTPEF